WGVGFHPDLSSEIDFFSRRERHDGFFMTGLNPPGIPEVFPLCWFSNDMNVRRIHSVEIPDGFFNLIFCGRRFYYKNILPYLTQGGRLLGYPRFFD
ncbi:MAG: hypothetical protein WC873_04530, partial [Candidatus Gracilibacteria bacterium]